MLFRSVAEWLYKHIDGSKAELDLSTELDLDVNSLRVVVHGPKGEEERKDGQDDTRVQNSDN